MRKRERENPCGICGHYHKYEEGEICGVCGHRAPILTNNLVLPSAFPSQILKDFLYLGSYDNATRNELLKSQGISRILNTVPACQTLYKNSFIYFCLKDGKYLQFNEAIGFLEQCARDKARVLVHCMLGKNRSAAIVIAYLMKSKGWRLAESYQWTKERRSDIDISTGVYEQLLMFEKSLFGNRSQPSKSSSEAIFGNEPGGSGSGSIFEKISSTLPPSGFVFGATANGDKEELPPSPAMMMMDNNNINNNNNNNNNYNN